MDHNNIKLTALLPKSQASMGRVELFQPAAFVLAAQSPCASQSEPVVTIQKLRHRTTANVSYTVNIHTPLFQRVLGTIYL
jgi:hypothetical protein